MSTVKRPTAKLALTAISLAATLLLVPSAGLANFPPPNPLPTPANPYSKGPTIRLAYFSSTDTVEQRGYRQGATYKTGNYCSALIDIGAWPGLSATIQVTGYDDELAINKYAEFPEPIWTFTGTGKTNADGAVVESRVVPLLHNVTEFDVNLTPQSATNVGTSLYVFMTPLPCGYRESQT
jgi:hypothetical protein